MGRGPWRYDLSARLSARATDDCVITGTRCLSQPTWPRGAAVEGDHTSPRLKVGGHFGAKPKGSSLNDRGAGDPKRRFNYASERPRSGTWRPTQAHRELQAKQNKTKHVPRPPTPGQDRAGATFPGRTEPTLFFSSSFEIKSSQVAQRDMKDPVRNN